MRAAAPVSLVVLTLALRGRLKVGLDVEQACQGVVTHTRSVRQLVTPPSCLGSGSGACASYPPTPVALCEPKGVLNSRLQLTLVFLALAWTAASAWRVQLSRHSRMAREQEGVPSGQGHSGTPIQFGTLSTETPPCLRPTTERRVMKNEEKQGTQKITREGRDHGVKLVKDTHCLKPARAGSYWVLGSIAQSGWKHMAPVS